MKATLATPGVIHLTTATQYELSSTFMRMQEFYESANGLQGKFFTLEECMDTYAAGTDKREFSYTTDWAGFNVPGHVVDKFFDLFWDDLQDKEYNMYQLIHEQREKDDGEVKGKYYVIGTHECLEASYYLYHEMCHAFWYMHPSFKKSSLRLIKKLPAGVRKVLCDQLVEDGYAHSVLEDECNAYLATSDMRQIKDQLLENYTKPIPWETIALMQANFYDFLDELQEDDK